MKSTVEWLYFVGVRFESEKLSVIKVATLSNLLRIRRNEKRTLRTSRRVNSGFQITLSNQLKVSTNSNCCFQKKSLLRRTTRMHQRLMIQLIRLSSTSLSLANSPLKNNWKTKQLIQLTTVRSRIAHFLVNLIQRNPRIIRQFAWSNGSS